MQQIKAQHISVGSGYEVGQSLLFDTYHLDRSVNVSGNRKKWTFSCWAKRCLGDVQVLFGTGNVESGTSFGGLYFDTDDSLMFFDPLCGATKQTNAKYRDASAWFHIVTVLDVANNAARIYINGEEITDWKSSSSPIDVDGNINNTTLHSIGKNPDTSAHYLKGYLSEIHFIDGQALGSENFALTDSNGVYNPIPYSGTYGTNGFYLPFEASDIGADNSGNDNDFTPNGFTSDSVVADTPTNNYSVWMPFPAWFTSANGLPNYSASNGNKSIQQSGEGKQGAYIESMQLSTGKFWRAWHIDTYETNGNYDYMYVGFASAGSSYRLQDVGVGVNNTTGAVKFWDGAAETVFVPSLTYGQGDTIGFAVDLDAGIVEIYKNGSLEYTSDPSSWRPTSDAIIFGVEFYTPTATMKATISDEGAPDGYLPLCTQNLPDTLVNPKETLQVR